MAEKKHPDKNHGKKPKQRMKPYIVHQYLLKETDESHYASGKEIEGYLQEICDIYAERRSIYKDIDEINEVNFSPGSFFVDQLLTFSRFQALKKFSEK